MRLRILGLDVGIASIGWAILEFSNGLWRIIAAGVYTFNSPVVGGTGKDKFASLAAYQRRFRGAMRQHHRKRKKMNELRAMLFDIGLLPNASKSALADAQVRISPRGTSPQITPYLLRDEALTRLLTSDEFGVLLGSFIARCGFKPAARAKGRNEEEENNRILAASRTLRNYSQEGYQTIGQKIAQHPDFRSRKRNKRGDFAHTVIRSELHDEIRTIFYKQCEFGNPHASNELRDRMTGLMDRTESPPFDYYPVAGCRFEAGEPRAARRSPSFELFRLHSRLKNLRVAKERAQQSEIDAAIEFARKNGSVTYADLRLLWKLPDPATFDRIAKEYEGQDVAERNGMAMPATILYRELFGDRLCELAGADEKLDQVSWIVSFATSEMVVERDLRKLALPVDFVEVILDAYHNGKFNSFAKAGHLSAMACRKLTALLPGADDVTECEFKLYGVAPPRKTLAPIHNQVTRRTVRETCEQVVAIILEYGTVDRIHVEFSRDVARSAEARAEAEIENNKRNSANKKLLDQFRITLNQEPRGDQALMFSLWEEQHATCLYTGDNIDPKWIVSGANELEIDHILPRWRSGMMRDRNNLTLCRTGANRDKGDLTPFEWFHGPRQSGQWSWDHFASLVKTTNSIPRKKKRFLLMTDASNLKKGFRKRSLVDTQYAARLIPDALRIKLGSTLLTELPEPKIIARPAKLVSWMRHSWGIDHLKYPNGERTSDDRHHAVDAVVIAAVTDKTLVRAIRAAKANERSGRSRFHFTFESPWPDFKTDVQIAYDKIFVARAPKTDFAGRIHADTAYALAEVEVHIKKRGTNSEPTGQAKSLKVVVRKSIDDLVLKDLENIKDSERNHRLVEILTPWAEANTEARKAKKKCPAPRPVWKYRDPDGGERFEEIRKVSLLTTGGPKVIPKRVFDRKKDRPVASFDRSEMAYVDVFRKHDGKGRPRYYVVPIYPHQMTMDRPPNLAVNAGKPEEKWTVIDESFEFIFSLRIHEYVQVLKSDDEAVEGYYKGLDSEGGKIALAAHNNLDDKKRGIGTRTLSSFKKFTIDRLGRKSEVLREVRTWRGRACT